MTPIKCPPPKIVAVKRSLKRPDKHKQNIMDDDELSVKDDFINDDDSLSSFDAKDLIEFERDEPLIDLSEEELPPGHQKKSTRDTVSDRNAKNSNTLLSLLDLLEIGNVMRATETARAVSCAEDDNFDTNPFVPTTSSSSSLNNIPGECPGACAASSGKTDKLSTVFPPLSNQPENPSIVKNCCHQSVELFNESKSPLSVAEGEECVGRRVREGIDEKFIDSTLQNSHQCQSEKLEENFSRTSPSSDCSTKPRCCIPNSQPFNDRKICDDESNKEKENFATCHYNHHQQLQQQQQNDVKVFSTAQSEVQKTKSEQSDSNNNRESVCDQNSSRTTREASTNSDESLKFLSPHTSQRKLPPKFYSSTNSLNRDCFEASSRLKRLEERFKGFSYTKKLLRGSKVFSKSEEILSSYGKSCESLNPNVQFPLSSTTLSENCLRQLTEERVEVQKDFNGEISKGKRTSSSDGISGEFSGFASSSCTFIIAIIDRHESSLC